MSRAAELTLSRTAAADRAPIARLATLAAFLLTWVLTLPVAAFGLVQIGLTTFRQLSGPAEMVDFVAFYTGARLLLEQPARIYDPAAWLSLQTALHGVASPLLQFWNPPHTALLLAPLGLLPYGAAYLVWLAINLACLGASAYVLLPRGTARRELKQILSWAVVLPTFLPVQLGLIMGQLCFVLLLGFAVYVRLLARGGPLGQAAALVTWTTKPQLLPALVLSLGLRKRWWTIALLGAVPGALSVPVIVLGGPSLITEYVQLAHGAGSGVLTAEGVHLASGHSLLGLAQWLFGASWAATTAAVIATSGVCLLVGGLWRNGLRSGARRHLQLAALPLAAVLLSPHALGYDAVTWLASAWLLLTYARLHPEARGSVAVLLLVGWWAGNLAAMPDLNAIAPWGGFGALLCLGGVARLFHQAEVQEARGCTRA